MGQLTSSIKSYSATTVDGAHTGSYIYLDKERSIDAAEAGTAFDTPTVLATDYRDGFFPHAGKNCHHFIVYSMHAGDHIELEYTLDNTTWVKVWACAAGGAGFVDTGCLAAGDGGTTSITGGAGVAGCPPLMARLKVVGGGHIDSLQVRTYGTVVR